MLNPLLDYTVHQDEIFIHNKLDATEIFFKLKISLTDFNKLSQAGPLKEIGNGAVFIDFFHGALLQEILNQLLSEELLYESSALAKILFFKLQKLNFRIFGEPIKEFKELEKLAIDEIGYHAIIFYENDSMLRNYLAELTFENCFTFSLIKCQQGNVRYVSPVILKRKDLENRKKVSARHVSKVQIDRVNTTVNQFVKTNFVNMLLDYYTDFYTNLAYNWERAMYLTENKVEISERIG
jgi:hypothetical protein